MPRLDPATGLTAPARVPSEPKSAPPMKAVAVLPGQPDSMHLAELAKPSMDQIPGGRGVLVKVLQVGVDGTDKGDQRRRVWRRPPGL